MEEGKSLLEILEKRQRKREMREKRDTFLKRVRGEIEPSPLIRRIRGGVNDINNRCGM